MKTELYLMMTQFGPVLDVVAQKTPKKRGQAFVVFRDVAAAAAAMRALQSKTFLGKPMRIQFAKTKSDAIAELEGDIAEQRRRRVQKRLEAARQAAAADEHPGTKRPRSDENDTTAPGQQQAQDSDEQAHRAKRQKVEQSSKEEEKVPPSKMLLVTGLPEAYTEAMLGALFGQVAGFVNAKLVPVAQGMAVVEFENEVVARVAMERLRGFKADATHTMSIAFMKTR